MSKDEKKTPAAPPRPPAPPRRSRCCRCATWWSTRTWSSRCSSAARSRSSRSSTPWKDSKQILLVAQKSPEVDDPAEGDVHRVGVRGGGAADAQAARRHREGAGRGRRARPHRGAPRRRVLHRRGRRHPRRDRIRSRARGRRADALGHRAVRAVRQAQQEDPARDPDLARRDRFDPAAWPTPSPPTSSSSSTRSSACSRSRTCARGSSTCSA